MNIVHFYHGLSRENDFLNCEIIAKFDFYCKMTAKLAILQFRGTAKLGMNYRAKYRPLQLIGELFVKNHIYTY